MTDPRYDRWSVLSGADRLRPQQPIALCIVWFLLAALRRHWFLPALLALATTAGATTYVVLPGGGGDFETIQEALDAAVDEDIVELGDGTFTGDGNRNLDFLGKAVTLRSQSGNPADCIIDCEGSESDLHLGVEFHSGEGTASVLEGVTITGGWHDSVCGGILINRSNPTITNCILRQNHGYYGGGVMCDSASPAITEVVFLENWADVGAGMMTWANSHPAVSGCTFTSNTSAYDGAGINCWFNCAPTITGCLFTDNFAVYRGGALLFSDDTRPVVTGCTIANNEALWGGAAMVCGGSVTQFRDCTMYGNQATQSGAHLQCGCHGHALLDNCILAFGAPTAAVDCVSDGRADFTCSDIFGNAGGDWTGSIADQEGINGNFSADPLFCDAPAGDLTLHFGSPCLAGHHPNDEDCGRIGAWPLGCPAGAVDDPSVTPYPADPLSARPNPFCGAVTITLSPAALDLMPAPSVRILDISGRLVRTLMAPADAAGRLRWDGRRQNGTPAPSGIYYCRMDPPRTSGALRIILAR